jgi:hypothetical protein
LGQRRTAVRLYENQMYGRAVDICRAQNGQGFWIPAFAGMTVQGVGSIIRDCRTRRNVGFLIPISSGFGTPTYGSNKRSGRCGHLPRTECRSRRGAIIKEYYLAILKIPAAGLAPSGFCLTICARLYRTHYFNSIIFLVSIKSPVFRR